MAPVPPPPGTVCDSSERTKVKTPLQTRNLSATGPRLKKELCTRRVLKPGALNSEEVKMLIRFLNKKEIVLILRKKRLKRALRAQIPAAFHC